MENNKGQDINKWSESWSKLSIESEIQMWDYFGLRPWILKYTPRYGKVVEAGCGLGRYNFYLSHLGIDTIGLDFSADAIKYLDEWSKRNGYNIPFIAGDVKCLPFADDELSGYLSFGVIEHFIEGPEVPLAEAYRVLRPGGIAIITTPNHTWSKHLLRISSKSKKFLKKIIGHKVLNKGFFQYEYSPGQLKNFIKRAGFKVTEYTGTDFLYTFTEYGIRTNNFNSAMPWFFRISKFIDTSFLRILGSQSVTVSVKPAEKMYCFFCGEKKAMLESLNLYHVPVCNDCINTKQTNFYAINVRTYFNQDYIINPPFLNPENRVCAYCGANYKTDPLFEDFGFSRNVCQTCLLKREVNIDLSNNYIKPVWRFRLK